MNIRSTATQWYQKHFGEKAKYFRSSKYFEPHESWSKTPVWWFQVPQQWLDEKLEAHVMLIGEKAPGQNDFFVLKVPVYFFLGNLKRFTHLEDKTINLMLSAENHNEFKDVGGKGNVEFAKFLVKGR